MGHLTEPLLYHVIRVYSQYYNMVSLSVYRLRLWEPSGCFVHWGVLHNHTGLDVSLPVFILQI